MSIYDWFLIFSIFCFILDVAIHVYFDLQYRRDKKDPDLNKYSNIKHVRSIIIDSHGFLAIIKNPGDPVQHVFCRRLNSFCSTSCQFFSTADNHFDEKKPCFDCWMLADMYAAPERIDWRNTKPNCAPEKKP